MQLLLYNMTSNPCALELSEWPYKTPKINSPFHECKNASDAKTKYKMLVSNMTSEEDRMMACSQHMHWMLRHQWSDISTMQHEHFAYHLYENGTLSIVDFLPPDFQQTLQRELMACAEATPDRYWSDQKNAGDQIQILVIPVLDARIENLGTAVTNEHANNNRLGCSQPMPDMPSLRALSRVMQWCFPQHRYADPVLVRYKMNPERKHWHNSKNGSDPTGEGMHVDGNCRRDNRPLNEKGFTMWTPIENMLPVEFSSVNKSGSGRRKTPHMHCVTNQDVVFMSEKTWHRTGNPNVIQHFHSLGKRGTTIKTRLTPSNSSDDVKRKQQWKKLHRIPRAYPTTTFYRFGFGAFTKKTHIQTVCEHDWVDDDDDDDDETHVN